MSSTEQAPEPTMDEILASIRKIIADDDQNAAQQSGDTGAPASAPESAPAASPGGGEEAASSSSLVNDIANALNQPPAPSETDDDIFELTREVAPEAPAAEQPAAEETPAPAQWPGSTEPAPAAPDMTGTYGRSDAPSAQPEEAPFAAQPATDPFAAQGPEEPQAPALGQTPFAEQGQEDPLTAQPPQEEPFTTQPPSHEDPFATQTPQPITRTPGEAASPVPPPAPEQEQEQETAFAAEEPAPQSELSGENADILAGTPMQEAPLPGHATGFGTGQPEPPAPSEAAEPASGLERAPIPNDGDIANLDDFTPEPAPSMPPADDIAMGTPAAEEEERADAGQPEFAPSASSAEPGGVPPASAGEMPADSDLAWSTGSDAGAAESIADSAASMFGATAFEDAAFAESPRADTAPGDAAAAGTPAAAQSGETGATAGPENAKTLEESVQEMLRPMLRAWLDENMPRILENTLRQELNSGSDSK
jgi:cell pole-organizing protein PopZ